MASKKYQCDQCGQKFNDPRALGSHRKFKHGIAGANAARNARAAKAKVGRPLKNGAEIPVSMFQAISFCPHCGFDVRSLAVAIGFIEQRRARAADMRATYQARKKERANK